MATLKPIENIIDVNQKCMFFVDTNSLRKILTQDRQSLHTSLVEAVEGQQVDEGWKNNGIYTGGYDQAKEDILTIINSIFKE
jgi:hypothetical protein